MSSRAQRRDSADEFAGAMSVSLEWRVRLTDTNSSVVQFCAADWQQFPHMARIAANVNVLRNPTMVGQMGFEAIRLP